MGAELLYDIVGVRLRTAVREWGEAVLLERVARLSGCSAVTLESYQRDRDSCRTLVVDLQRMLTVLESA